MAGATTQADRQAQVLAAGYNGPMTDAAINQAYANAATPSDLASSGLNNAPAQTAGVASGGDSGGGGGQSFAQQLTQAAQPISQATSGVTAAQLAENKRQFDATLAQQQKMWELQGLPELVIAQKTQAAQQAEYESQQQIARGNLALAQQTQAQSNAATVAGLTGMYYSPQQQAQAQNLPTAADFANLPPDQQAPYLQYHGANAASDWARDAGAAIQNATAQQQPQQQGPGTPTLAAQQQQFSQGLQRGQLGLQYLTQAAQLGGPANYFQSVAFNRGAQQAGQMPAFLQSLANNTGLAAFNGPGGAAAQPGVQSMGSLANGLTNPGNDQANAALAKIGAIGAAGGQALAPQALENLNPDEMDLFKSGLKASGISAPAFLQQYAASRIGQGSSQAY